jgi:methylenetetrahydrofolate dehydrogenase (NADP+) / methenyltetrahydrofolate cyclohydrolase
MTAGIIDGKAIAAQLRARVADEVARVKRDNGLTPGLAVVLVGNDPASCKHRPSFRGALEPAPF